MATNGHTSEPLDVALAVIPSLPRALLTRLVTRAIDRLDEIDGDPDLELTGEENEPDFSKPLEGYGPGCPISEPDLGIEDMPQDEEHPDIRRIADPEAYRFHVRRLRDDRCYRLGRHSRHRFDGAWRLFTDPVVPNRRQIMRRKRGLPKWPRA
ncbi:hypothetical protein [Sphingosinicella rhizophila]|uniref:Uncharacterized protein n=1 Tax=Sphingosinicella rhizophila TaxID=3050082 RepID=A0ABU3Q6I2_9SPHN|nr:hypothetical protein [Sphingosinicella sp. GR2756]MDT9598540.1 hypothetical protein [Sphingosinicella sp. GR2756]